MLKLVSQIFAALEAHISLIGRVAKWLGSIAGGLVSVWGVWATEALQTYAPFSYIAAGLLGTLVVASVLSFIGWFTATLARASYYNRLRVPTQTVNPIDDSFDKKRISVSDLADPVTNVVENKIFTVCELVGQSVAVFSGCHFRDGLWFFDCDFAVFRDDRDEFTVRNAVIFQNCVFTRCKFYRLLMFVNKSTAADLDRIYGGSIKWLIKSD